MVVGGSWDVFLAPPTMVWSTTRLTGGTTAPTSSPAMAIRGLPRVAPGCEGPLSLRTVRLLPDEQPLPPPAQAGLRAVDQPILQSLSVAHTWRYHKRHRTSGHVWQGRFKSPVIQDDDHPAAQKQDKLTAVRDSLRTGRPLGSPAWVEGVATRLGIDLTPPPRGRPRKEEWASVRLARKMN